MGWGAWFYFAIALTAGAPAWGRAGPPALLSKTGLYRDITHQDVDPANLSYQPQYPLWTDGALKKRWVYFPPGTQVTTDSGDATLDRWVFPVGTKLWKEFSFPKPDGNGWKRVETRHLQKIDDTRWQYATYLWNDAETEATLAPDEGLPDYYPTGPGTTHNIPATAECKRCHLSGGDGVLGFTALQLSTDRDPLAPHGEPFTAQMLTLQSLSDRHLLTALPTDLLTHPPRIAAATPAARAAVGYLVANCASCHNPQGGASYTHLFFHHPLATSAPADEPSFSTSVNQLNTTFQLPDHPGFLRIKAGDPDASSVVYSMQSPQLHRMPPLGTKIPDAAAMDVIRQWIQNISNY